MQLRKILDNAIGWRTNRKIVVFESDDLGSIRMPSREVFDSLVKKGFAIKDDPYCNNDAMERNVDLERLFETLSKFKDATGRIPVITGLCLVANPDFMKIEESNFAQYFYKKFQKL